MFLTLSRPDTEPLYMPLSPGERSPSFDLRAARPLAKPAPTAIAADTTTAPEPETTPAPSDDGIGPVGIMWRYLVLGYQHIIPHGHDHELFILGLFLLSPRLKDLLWQTSAFTLAHTCTLTLATIGWVQISPAIVEPIIAASIACIAIENLCTDEPHRWRMLVAFVFGLVHGLGFASGLAEIGLPTRDLLAGVLAFSVGVEGGHLTILALAFLLLGWFRPKKWFRPRIAIPLSSVLACIALFWFVQRLC